jgi:ADP-ribose pyrophosphatase YjhB (NUDIX family)
MYTIYINEKPLIFISEQEIDNFKGKGGVLLNRYPRKSKFLLNYIDMMEKGMGFDKIVLYDENPKIIYKDLKKIVIPVSAAGGLVINEKGELLVILRKGKWDLPKGQIADGETKKSAAEREIMEETGIIKITTGEKAGKTLHIFKRNRKRYLKISHWYFMNARKSKLYPERREMITKAEWILPDVFLKTKSIYAGIEALLKNVFEKKHSSL